MNRTLIAALTSAGALLALTACTLPAEGPAGPGASASVEPAVAGTAVAEPGQPAPDAAPTAAEPPATPVPGDRVEEQSLAVEAYQAGLGYYDWKDGTYTIVDPHAPLPADIVTDIKTLYGYRGDRPVWTSPEGGPGWEVRARTGSTRKTFVFILVSGQFMNQELISYGWHAASADRDFGPQGQTATTTDWWDTKEDAIAFAQSVIATRPDPSVYELVDLAS